jgi:hypothetical protein
LCQRHLYDHVSLKIAHKAFTFPVRAISLGMLIEDLVFLTLNAYWLSNLFKMERKFPKAAHPGIGKRERSKNDRENGKNLF